MVVLALGTNSVGYAKGRASWPRSVPVQIAVHDRDAVERVAPRCVAELVGDAHDQGHVVAVAIGPASPCRQDATTRIDTDAQGRRTYVQDAADGSASVRFSIVSFDRRGVGLLRVAQNFGGSASIVRYVLVSAADWRPANPRNPPIAIDALVGLAVLPASIATDDAALAYIRP